MKPHLIIGVVVFSWLVGSANADEPFTLFRFQTHSPHEEREERVYEQVEVDSKGHVKVKLQRDSQPKEFEFQMNPDELAAFNCQIESAAVFEHSAPWRTYWDLHGGDTFEIERNQDRQVLKNVDEPAVDPLRSTAHKLVRQAEVTLSLKSGIECGFVAGAISSGSGGPEVFSPRLLMEPLRDAIASCDDLQKLEWGLEEIADVVSPEEWLGLISRIWKTANVKKRTLWLNAMSHHPFYDNIPKSHLWISMPFLLKVLKDQADAGAQLDQLGDQAYSGVCRLFGTLHYQDSIPVLKQLSANGINRETQSSARAALELIQKPRPQER